MRCRLDLAESIRVPTRGPRRNPFETALAEAERQEAQNGPPAELPFTATVLCVGLTGVGKTATILNLLGRQTDQAPAFAPETKKVSAASLWPCSGLQMSFITDAVMFLSVLALAGTA
jgi:Cdc6-like AAA superfamily ATPase